MIDDKYIGLIIALSGSVCIGSSFIFTKKVRLFDPQHPRPPLTHTILQGLIHASDTGSGAASDQHTYFKSPLWWTGMTISESICPDFRRIRPDPDSGM